MHVTDDIVIISYFHQGPFKRSSHDMATRVTGIFRSLTRSYATSVTGYGREVEGFVGAVGNTPLVCQLNEPGLGSSIANRIYAQIRLNRLSTELGSNILAKAEFMSPGGSVKDRAALYLVKDAEEKGLIRPGGTVVEGTAGNTGIGLAHVCRSKGYRCVIYMPDTQSQEKIDLLRMLGADVRPVPGECLPCQLSQSEPY